MARSFVFYHNDDCFKIVCRANDALDIETGRLMFNVNYFFRESRATYQYLSKIAQHDLIEDLDFHCVYDINRMQHVPIEWPLFSERFEFYLISQPIEPRNLTFNVTNFGQLTFTDSINLVSETINNLSAKMSSEDVVLLRELVNQIINNQKVEKSGLERFKEMLINNTDVLGLFAQILIAIIHK